MEKLYCRLNEFLKNKFKERTLKICIDGSFTCPNRDGTKGVGGCIFCSNRGSGDFCKRTSITEQMESYFKSYRSLRADSYIAYFQNFTNTYDSISNLKKKYDEALSFDERIVALDIDTRPDCISEEVCQLLSTYKDKYYVYCELGLQTSNEDTHQLINQNITNEDFIKAVNLLNKYGIDVVVHIMVGLPNETHEDIIKTIEFLAKINYQGIKIHSTYIVKNTELEKMYLDRKYNPISYEDYMNELVYIITHIKEDVIIHRLTGDPKKEDLVVPEWTTHKKRVIIELERRMKENNLYQGIYYGKE